MAATAVAHSFLLPKGFDPFKLYFFFWTFVIFCFRRRHHYRLKPPLFPLETRVHKFIYLWMWARLSSRFTQTKINAEVCASCSNWHLLSRNEMTTLISYWFYQRLPLDLHRRHEKERPEHNGWHAEMDRNEKQIVDDIESEETINIGCVELWMLQCAEYALAINGPPLRLQESSRRQPEIRLGCLDGKNSEIGSTSRKTWNNKI